MTTNTNIATISAIPAPAPVAASNTQIGFFNMQGFELIQRVAKAFATSTLVPTQYQGNVANAMLALNMAQRMDADPLMVMQNLNIIHGRPSWSSKFLIATFNNCGRFSAMRFEFEGDENSDGWRCRAYSIERSTGAELKGTWISIAMSKAEGWYGKPGSKWKTMPEQMLRYRAASFFIGTYAPEISMGFTTEEEAYDIIDVTPERVPAAPAVNAKIATIVTAKPAPAPAPKPEPAPIVTAAPVDPEPDSTEWPQDEDGVLVDARCCPWIEAVHSEKKTCTKDNNWRKRRGIDPAVVAKAEHDAIEARLPQLDLESKPAPTIDLEQVLAGIARSNNEDEIDLWLDHSRMVELSTDEDERLTRAVNARMNELERL
jgi:hypothetical protein